MNRRSWLLTGLLLAAFLLALAGQPQMNRALAQDAMSRVRFLHAVPGAPNVDVYVDGALAAPGLGYREATPHLNVTAGDHQIAVRQAGSDAAAPALIEVPVPLAADLAFMVVLQGTAEVPEAALYEDILDEIAPGQARLTAVNTIADAPPLDVVTTAGGPILQGVSYGVQFGTVNIQTSVQDLVMVPAGGAVESAVATIGTVPLQSGMLYTFVSLGTLEGATPASAIVLATPVNGTADAVRVRIAHGSPDTPAVDVYANDLLLVPSLELGEMSGHIALPAGAYSLGLRPAGSPAADAPTVSADVTLDAATPAVTVVALGEVSDGSLALQVFPDNVAGVVSDQARIAVVNAVPGAAATIGLSDPSATVLASALTANTQSEAVDVPAGRYMLTVSIQGIDTPVDVMVPEESYNGGMYYSVLVFGGGVTGVPFDARVAGTEIAVTADSLPGASTGMAVAEAPPTEEAPPPAEPTEAPPATEETPPPAEAMEEAPPVEPTEAPPAEAQPTDTELVVDDAPPPDANSEVVQATPTPPPPPPPTQPAGPIGYVELDPNANLHCREYPRSDARSLGLIPSGTALTVLGRTGEPIVPDTGDPTPEPTPVVETIEDLWVAVRWEPEGGGYVRCWVAVQFLRVEYQGRLLDDLEELLELPEEPFNLPGEVVNASVSPPTPVFNAILATVNLDPGVSLQLRRYPKTDAEALDRVPAGAQMEVLGYVEAPSEGLVGQPVDPNWIRVRYVKENGGATVGWVSAQYVTLSQLDKPVELTDLVVLDPEEAGFYESPGLQPVIPIEEQDVIGVVNLDPGANLNLRDRPSADAFVVVGVPSGSVLTINGRNGDGTWVQVTYESDLGMLEGWVAVQYLVITQGGQPVDLGKLPNLSDEADTFTGQAAPQEEVPTEEPAQQ
jgi:hypothetical protein